jgi:hypothetical protein
VNVSTRGSSARASSAGKGSGSRAATIASRDQYASSSPTAPPRIDSITLSVSSCAINRDRFAPIASRIATSRRRFDARASSRFAMLPHAISRTMPTTTISSDESRVTWLPPRPLGSSRAASSDTAVALRPLLSVGNACSRLANTVLRFDRACSGVTPGLSRPNAKRNSPRRVSHQAVCGTSFCAIGSQAAGPPPSSVPAKCFGATPMTVYGTRLSVSVLPTTCGSAPRLRCQNPSLMTATGADVVSSSGRNARPRTGWTPSRLK